MVSPHGHFSITIRSVSSLKGSHPAQAAVDVHSGGVWSIAWPAPDADAVENLRDNEGFEW